MLTVTTVMGAISNKRHGMNTVAISLCVGKKNTACQQGHCQTLASSPCFSRFHANPCAPGKLTITSMSCLKSSCFHSPGGCCQASKLKTQLQSAHFSGHANSAQAQEQAKCHARSCSINIKQHATMSADLNGNVQVGTSDSTCLNVSLRHLERSTTPVPFWLGHPAINR